jgi:large subunit ribosomal protein L4
MKIGQVEVKKEVFGVEVKPHILWEVVRWQLAKRRQGTHSTKTRGEVAYSGRKILPQKGTGHARRGDRGANILVGGGVAHGPKPRDYEYSVPKKVRKLALRMALSSRAKEKAISFVEKIEIGKEPKTKKALEFLKKKKLSDRKVLIVLKEKDEIIYKSFRNLQNVRVLSVEGLNVYDILWSDHLIIQKSCLEDIYRRTLS